MITLTFEKIYLKERNWEPCSIAVPIAKGKLRNIEGIVVAKDGIETLSQTKVTSYWEDGSIRFLFVRFLANLPGNLGTSYELYLDRTEFEESKKGSKEENSILSNEKTPNALCLTKDKVSSNYTIDTGVLTFTTKTGQGGFLKEVKCGGSVFEESQFGIPKLYVEQAGACDFKLHEFHVVEEGPGRT